VLLIRHAMPSTVKYHSMHSTAGRKYRNRVCYNLLLNGPRGEAFLPIAARFPSPFALTIAWVSCVFPRPRALHQPRASALQTRQETSIS
jgi:hypothetical protein